jgi:hypothetical protein
MINYSQELNLLGMRKIIFNKRSAAKKLLLRAAIFLSISIILLLAMLVITIVTHKQPDVNVAVKPSEINVLPPGVITLVYWGHQFFWGN